MESEKRGLKSEFEFFQVYRDHSIFWSRIANNYNQVQREKENFFVASKSSIKREIRNFHVVVVQ